MPWFRSGQRTKTIASGFFLWVAAVAAAQTPADHRWWPTQTPPRGVVTVETAASDGASPTKGKHGSASPQATSNVGPEQMLVQSLAGLAAQAVNQGRFDEMVWVSPGKNDDFVAWHQGLVRRLHIEERGALGPWDLLDRYVSKDLVKGYVLYRYDQSVGRIMSARPGSDPSANVATTLCGLLGGVLISEELEGFAKAHGLRLLADVRGKSMAWCFQQYRDRLNRNFVLSQDPQAPHGRDLAIAQRMLVLYGREDPTPAVFAWLNPLSSVIGWGAGDEGKTVTQISRFGHILLPSNWTLNLPLLSAGSEAAPIGRLPAFDPHAIAWPDKSPAAAFVMSDGDNVSWLLDNFFHNAGYWGSPDHGKFPLGWGVPCGCLAQVCPEALQYLLSTQRKNTTIIPANGGYYYPDLFGADRSDVPRIELLTRHAQRINHYQQQLGARTLLLLCMDIDSPEARQAYAVYAREIDGLVGLLALEYSPYEAGNGRVLWVKNRSGTEIPVVTCKYCIWANLKSSRSGTPTKIASLLNHVAGETHDVHDPLLCWTMTHAWSGFRKVNSRDIATEDALPQTADMQHGVTPTYWCVQKLNENIRVVSPEELLWRIRWQHGEPPPPGRP